MDAIHLPNAITLPTTFGAPGTPLQPGQVVQALVLELIESDIFRLRLPQAIVDVRSDVRLDPGSTVTLAVKGGGANARLTIYADAAPAPPAARQGDAAPKLAGSELAAPKLAAPKFAAPNLTAPSLTLPGLIAPSVAGRRPIGEAVIIARAPGNTPGNAPKASLETPVARATPPIILSRTLASSPLPQMTPERALGEAMRVAAARQSGLAPLFADVEQIAQAPPGTVPAPVRAAAEQIAALRVPFDESLTAADVKQAFVRSGVLLEPRLAARAQATPEPPQVAPQSSQAASAPHLKPALLVLRQVLKTWADDTAPQRAAPFTAPVAPDHADAPRAALPLADGESFKHLAGALAGAANDLQPESPPLSPEQATTLAKSVGTQLLARETPDHSAPTNPNGLPPPYRGAPLTAQQPVAASINADTPPRESAERLLAETDGALARTTLMQAASLPDQPAQRTEQAAQRWTFEVPFAAPQGTGIAQFEVSRDGRAGKSDRQLPTWRARFSLDLEPMGPVHALVALAGQRASVTLWAERISTATQLNDQAPMLSEALRAADLEPSDFQLRVGAPPVAAKQASPGRFMDRAT